MQGGEKARKEPPRGKHTSIELWADPEREKNREEKQQLVISSHQTTGPHPCLFHPL